MHLDQAIIGNLIYSAIILAGAFAAIGGLNRVTRAATHHLKLSALSLRPVRVVIRYSVLVLALLLILSRFGYDTSALIALIGGILGLIAVGFFAVWSILSNLLCAFVIIIFKPFAIGDEVEVPGEGAAGKVADITLLFTTLRNRSGEDFQIPNNVFFQKTFKRRAAGGGAA